MVVKTIDLAYIVVDDSKGLAEVLKRVVGKVASSLAQNITVRLRERPPGTQFGTPVDTGWASSNWVPSVGKEIAAPVGSKRAVSTSTSDSGLQALRAYRWTPDSVIYVSNLVPYIQELDRGYSRQQPAGFVQRAIMQVLMTDMPLDLLATKF